MYPEFRPRRLLPAGLALVLLLSAALAADAQTLGFRVWYAGQDIGTLRATRSGEDAERRLVVESSVQVKMVLNLNMETYIEARYHEGVLAEARGRRSSSNDRLSDETTVLTRRQGSYVLRRKGKESGLDSPPITWCVADLYFREPRGATRIYSETMGAFLALRSLGTGAYRLTRDDGKANIYRYSGGRLMEVEVASPVGKTFIRRAGN